MDYQIEWIIELEDFPLYFISNLGKVYSKKNNKWREAKNLKEIRFYIGKDGYKYVTLSVKNKSKHKVIHRLLAETFIQNPDNKIYVDHINRIRTDNRLENLRWATARENAINITKQKNNTSGFTGVNYDKNTNKWRAEIYTDRYKVKSKRFKTKEEAINWRKEMEKKFYKFS